MTYQDTYKLQIYRRIIKYSPFAIKRKEGPMKIEHHLQNGETVRAVAPQHVTVEDAEKLFVILYLLQTQPLPRTEMQLGDIYAIATTIYIRDISKILNTHNYNNIITALQRLKELTIHYEFEKGSISLGLVHEIIYDETTGNIQILLNKIFYDACRDKFLSINLIQYLSLSPSTKNLYSYLCSNPADKFLEETLFERAGITAQNSWDKRVQLKKILNELVKHKYILNYKIINGLIHLKRPRQAV